MAVSCRIELLGELRIVAGEQAIAHFATQKTAALLAFLAFHRERSHPREQLIDMLWPWAGAASGRQSLSTSLTYLRRQLEPLGVAARSVLVADRAAVRIDPRATTTDVVEFESTLAIADREHEAAVRAARLETAIGLYRGQLLKGLHESWIAAEAGRLTEKYVAAVEALAELLVERGDVEAARSWLVRAVAAAPLREEPCRRLMRLCAAMGEPEAALAAYADLEAALGEEGNAAPSVATQELAGTIARQAAGAAAPAAGDRRPPSASRGARLPSGTVTLVAVRGDGGEGAAAVDRQALCEECRRHGGVEVTVAGGPPVAAFARAADALSFAAAWQLAAGRDAASGAARAAATAVAVHSSDLVPEPDGAYSSQAIRLLLRLLSAANPGQVLYSESAAGLVRHGSNGGLRLRELGFYRLRDVEDGQRLFQLDYPGGRDATPPLGADSEHVSRLPSMLTRFFGRKQELEELGEMLAGGEHLVTLVGAPGCGKTRLALEAASRFVRTFAGRVWFVPLADLRDGSQILDRALDPLGITRSPRSTPLDQVAAALGSTPALIVFDNFEHLMTAAGEVEALQGRVPELRCLVTSRRRLNLAREREFAVEPLPTSSAVALEELLANDSVRLFVDRAQAVRPGFRLARENAEAVASLCRRLEGIPLAIELAAARLNVLAPGQVLERLAEHELLRSRSRDGDERHRSLRAAIGWSCRLLPLELQRFLARLSVFRGGWTAEAAETVCDEPLASDYLAELTEISLVQADGGGNLEPRYRLLEMVRHYAAGELQASGDEPELRDRHFRHYYDLSKKFGDNRDGPDAPLWLDRVHAEHDNLMSALAWCQHAPGHLEHALSMASQLMHFWERRALFTVGRATLDRLLTLDLESEATTARCRVLGGAGILALKQGDLKSARLRYGEALIVARELAARDLEAAALNGLGNVTLKESEFARARQLFTEAAGVWREIGEEQKASGALMNVGVVAYEQGDYDVAWQSFSEYLASVRKGGRQNELTNALMNLGNVAVKRHDLALAQRLLEEALEVARSIDKPAMVLVLCNLGSLAHRMDNIPLAVSRYSEALKMAREHGLEPMVANSALNLGFLLREAGEPERARAHLLVFLGHPRSRQNKRYAAAALEYAALLAWDLADRPSCAESREKLADAARLYGAAKGIMSSSGAFTAAEEETGVSKLRGILDAPTFERAWNEGLAMTFDEAVAYAIELLESVEGP